MHHDHTHLIPEGANYCPTCGQKLPQAQEGYGTWEREQKSRRIGIAISIALHLLGVAYYFLKPSEPIKKASTAAKGEMIYIAPLAEKKKPTPKPKPPEPVKSAKAQPVRPKNSITPPPSAPKLETYVPPVVAKMTPPPEQDMSEMIAKRRAQRAADNPQPEPAAQESENDRKLRIARENIMGAQGRSASGEREQKGGLIEIINKNYHSADIKFHHWNVNFKRQWLQQLHIDQGTEPDIETAVVRRVIELVRVDYPEGDVPWESHRLGRVIVLSTRKADDAQLFTFLMKELFPEYTRGASR